MNDTGEHAKAISLTEEQTKILASTGNIKINAVAGSGKTTTIIEYAATRPKTSKLLYLAFNKTVRQEATKRFAEKQLLNVRVETAHSLAYKHIVISKGYSVAQNGYNTFEVASILGLKSGGVKHGQYILANHINKFVTYFCNSSASKVQELNYLDIVPDEKARSFVRTYYPQIEMGTRIFLSKMYKGEINVTHDFYLKQFQVSNPVLNYDYILFDEGQDASPAMLDIFLKQKAIKVIVGDAHQQIYAWRHAVNSLEKVDFDSYNLSTSFRFNQDIANLAMQILSWKNHLVNFSPVEIHGSGKVVKKKSKATLARTNLGLLLNAVLFIKEHPEVNKIYFEGNISSYTYAEEGASLFDVLDLYNNKREKIRDPLIRSMKTLKELEDYIEKAGDVQLSMLVEVVKEYGNEIPYLISEIKRKQTPDTEKEKAEMIFSTVHRCKGMEYDAVELADDFVSESRLEKLVIEKEEGEEPNILKWNEEINLLYVAITRSKGYLRIPETLLPENFLPSSMIQIVKVDKGKITAKRENGRYYENLRHKKNTSSFKHTSFMEKRLKDKNTSERWTKKTDIELKELYINGTKVKAIAEHFQRNQGAILSRLRKLGLQ